jgi:hypothetical protein
VRQQTIKTSAGTLETSAGLVLIFGDGVWRHGMLAEAVRLAA